MRKALYRKYRPVSLDTVVGQDQVITPLSAALKQHKISHAYLFTGPRGTGKTSVARIFAHEINGFPYELEDNYIDIIEIDAASNTGVDNIRELREKAIIAPTEGKYKVYIIDEVHMLSRSAFNALLKLMEEPPTHVVFIMATTNPEKVPVTITSRAQLFNFKLVSTEIIAKHLSAIAKKEKINIDQAALLTIAERGAGSFRDSISLLDQLSTLSEQKITAEAVEQALGLPAAQKITELLKEYSTGDLSAATANLRELLNSGITAESLATSLINAITTNPTPETLALATKLLDVAYPFPEAKLLLAFLGEGKAPIIKKTPVTEGTATTTQAPALDTSLATESPSQKVPEPTTRTSTEPAPASAQLTPSALIKIVKNSSTALSNILLRCVVEISDHTISIYPPNKGFEKILLSDSNHNLLCKAAPLFSIEVLAHTAKSPQSHYKNSELSAIMGEVQEVIEDDGDPFQ